MEHCHEFTDHSAVITDMEKTQSGDFIPSSSILGSVSRLLDDSDNTMEDRFCERNERAGLQDASLILDKKSDKEANFQSCNGNDTSTMASFEDIYEEKEIQGKPHVTFSNNSEMWKPNLTWAPLLCTQPPVVNQSNESNNLFPYLDYGNVSRPFFEISENNCSFEEYNENEELYSNEACSNPERKITSGWQGYECSSSPRQIGHGSDKTFFQPAHSFSNVPCADESKEANRLSSFSSRDNFDACFPQNDMSFGNRTEEEKASKSFGNTPAWNSFLAVGYQRKEEKYSNKLERQLPFQKESNENGMFPLMQPEIASALQMYHEDYSEPSKMQSAQSTTFPTAQHCAGTFSSLCDQNRMFTPQNSISHYGSNVTFPSASSCLSNSPCTSENIVDIKNNICDEHPHLKKIDQPSLDDALGLTNAARWERSATSPAFPAQPDIYEVESDGLAGGYAWPGLTPSAQGQHMNYQASQVQPCPPCYSKNMTYNIDAAQGHMDWHAPISPGSCPRNQLLSADKSTTSHKADNQYPHSQLYTRPEVKVKPSQCSVILPDARAVYCPGLPKTS
uniref:uncharacterized protein n=1 Tax=Myxine glutinosa TaxID=7769 RepID=UPI00358E2853